MTFDIGTVMAITPKLTIRQDGASTNMTASYRVGGVVAVGDRVLWTVVQGKLIVFTMTGV